LQALRKGADKHEKGVLEALASVPLATNTEATQVLHVRQLRIGMVIQEDVRNTSGNLIVSHGHPVTEGPRSPLRNYAEIGQLGTLELRVQMAPAGAGIGAA